MRIYVATTLENLRSLITNGGSKFEDYLTPEQFEFDSGVDEEEREHLISLLAAEDAMELNQGGAGYVLAIDIDEADALKESIEFKFSKVAALLYSEDGEELSWFAPEEISHQIAEWSK